MGYKATFLSETDTNLQIKWYNILGTPEGFDRLAVLNDDIFLPIESVGLTSDNVVAYMIETKSGEAFVTITGAVFISGQTILDMAAIAQPEKVDELEECISRLFEKTLDSELIQYPVNKELL